MQNLATSVSPAILKIPMEKDMGLIKLENPSGLKILIHPNGIPYAIRHASTLINRGLMTDVENGWFRLAVRIKTSSGSYQVIDLLNPSTEKRFAKTSDLSCSWSGVKEQLGFEVTLQLAPDSPTWTWTIKTKNLSGEKFSIETFYGQDLGLGDEGAVRNNEAYISQYLDHFVSESDAYGPVIMTRQNMPMADDLHPWIAQGCKEGTKAFSTDGFQFFGLEAKSGSRNPAFYTTDLPSVVRQYEFAYAGLQTAAKDLSPEDSATSTFFALYDANHPEASAPSDLKAISPKLAEFENISSTAEQTEIVAPTTLLDRPPVNGKHLEEDQLKKFFPSNHRNREVDSDGRALSFFHNIDHHVVTSRKEVQMERAHGHILCTGSQLGPDVDAIGTTVYADGIFNAQTYLGNPNFGRFLSVIRCPLNQIRLNGQRVFVELNGKWVQLGIPSAFEMGPRHARWIYHLQDRTLEITTWADAEISAVFLKASVLDGTATRFLITHQIVGGENEFSTEANLETNKTEATVVGTLESSAFMLQQVPDYAFMIAATEPDKIAVCSNCLPEVPSSSKSRYLAFESHAVSSISILLSASARGVETLKDSLPNFREKASKGFSEGESFRNTHAGGIHLENETSRDISRLNEIIPWYAHNAWIHFASPHGLEQYNGGAWGVRDVCQGSMEWLLAIGAYSTAREILVTVFSHQYRTDPIWPQWFMLEPFGKTQQAHAHGDIPFWPLKALCDYMEATEDYALLEEKLPYTDPESFSAEGPEETVSQHIDRIFEHFHARCVPGTALVNYGDGDWDDTLQPADPVLRSSMVSTWTVALTYHAFRQYHELCAAAGRDETAAELQSLLDKIGADFRKHLMPGGITSGFSVVEADGSFRPLLHPEDSDSGIRYRLLPMTRAILAGLFTREEAERHLDIIKEHLVFPDGAHLMSDPVEYKGGVSKRFKRAETASFFGREVGLQYVHAHIRYSEVLAKMGLSDETWHAMAAINPVDLAATVPNADIRQCNSYFSSSDAQFLDRYAAHQGYEALSRGDVKVSGGWRIYSSGPGLYLHKVVTRLAGMREYYGQIIFDPQLPKDETQLVVRRNWRGHELEITITRNPNAAHTIIIDGSPLDDAATVTNPYRHGGLQIQTCRFRELLGNKLTRIEVIVG